MRMVSYAAGSGSELSYDNAAANTMPDTVTLDGPARRHQGGYNRERVGAGPACHSRDPAASGFGADVDAFIDGIADVTPTALLSLPARCAPRGLR
jgi:hypothetical protein